MDVFEGSAETWAKLKVGDVLRVEAEDNKYTNDFRNENVPWKATEAILVSKASCTSEAMSRANEVHQGICCDGCGQGPIRGARWKCKRCADFDLCDVCHTQFRATGQHHTHGHEFNRIGKTDVREALRMRKEFEVRQCVCVRALAFIFVCVYMRHSVCVCVCVCVCACDDNMCCLLVLDSVTSTPQWIRQPKPRVR